MAWLFTAFSLWSAGARPIRIRPGHPHGISDLDGLIIGGGADVDPEAYEQRDFIQHYLKKTLRNRHKTFWQRIGLFFRRLSYAFIFLLRKIFSRKATYLVDKNRDELEFNLLDKAVKKGIPVLGICRGSQLINVYFQGNLFPDISSQYVEHVNKHSIFPVKEIHVKEGSRLAMILGTEHLWVNAMHHQAVNTTGTAVEAVAWEHNGIIQGIESTSHPFIIGVQWHPEYLVRRKTQKRIFKALVAQAKMH